VTETRARTSEAVLPILATGNDAYTCQESSRADAAERAHERERQNAEKKPATDQ
jgi:hypothetical protein